MGLWVFCGPGSPGRRGKITERKARVQTILGRSPQSTDTGTHCGQCRALRGKQEDMGDMPSHQEFQQLPPTLGKQARSGTLG